MSLRVAFAGTPRFAVAPLLALVQAGFTVVRVVTQPDRPAGRGMAVRPPPVKEQAVALGLGVWQPERPGPDQWAEELRKSGADVLVVAAFAQRIPVQALAFLPLGCLNVHPSLLPRWRGAAPVAWALWAGDRVSGVTIMQMDEGWDTGPILLQRSELIRPEDTALSLEERLSRLGARLLVEALHRLQAKTLRPVAQDPAGATLAPRLRKEHGRVDWQQDARAIDRQVRALYPWPGVYSRVRDKTVKLLQVAPEPADPGGGPGLPPGQGEAVAPGSIVRVDSARGSLVVACGSGLVHLLRVQPEGGRVMSGLDLANGLRLRPGDRFEACGP